MSVYCSPLVTCLKRADFLAVLCVTFSFTFVIFHMVSWVRCDTCLDLFLNFAFSLTFELQVQKGFVDVISEKNKVFHQTLCNELL